MPEALANSVSLSIDDPFQVADGYSTSIATATVSDAGPGETVDFTITDSGGDHQVIATTDNGGVASINIGPYPYGIYQEVTVTASYSGTFSDTQSVKFLAKNNLRLFISPDTTVPVGTVMTVTADWDVQDIPLTITAYDPYFNIIHTETIFTDLSGVAQVNFILSDYAGYNWVTVSMNGATVKSKYIIGTGGNISHFNLYTIPVSPIYADGKTSYILHIKALDSKDNAVAGKDITIYMDGEQYVTYPTNSNGVIAVNLGPSSFVQDLNITVVANDTLASDTIYLSYVKGFASNVSIVANPPVVANGNISTVPGQAEVHTTDIISTLTDYWGHPIQGETVYIMSLNTSLGNMWNENTSTAVPVASGVTDSSGEFAYKFKLNTSVTDSDIDIGVPVLTWYNNSTTGVDTSAICYIRYTDKPFVVATTKYAPSSNLSINDTINVTVNLRACGWVNATNYNNSAILVFDTSGSMDWLANTIYPTDGQPKTGTVAKATETAYNGWYGVDSADWHPIMDYDYSGDGLSDLQIMLSSDYRKYNGGTGSFYYLKVVYGGNSYDTGGSGYTGGSVVAKRSANENYVKFTNATSGTYHIYGAYMYSSSQGNSDYNMMILTNPKRLGQNSGTDLGSAAKVAGTEFVSLMDKNQVGVVWFNDSYAAPPVAQFTATPVVGKAPLSVSFTDLSSNSPSTWSWNFGDMSTSNQQNSSHTYNTAGVYSVRLTVSNTGGTDSVTYYNYITVCNRTPVPVIWASPTSGYVPLTVSFTDNSGDNSITSYSWNFGDGQTSNIKSPTHQFTSTGPYVVTLTTTNDGGSGTATKTITVIPHNPLPVANFTASPNPAKVKQIVYFTNKSTGAAISARYWNFGDIGSGNTSTSNNKTHSYKNAGTYTVTFTVTNDAGSDTKTMTVVVSNNDLPVADFTANQTSGNAPLDVKFTDASTGNAITWKWNFGDGTSNNVKQSPVHNFANPGTYNVTLTVTNDAGSSTLRKVNYITVNVAPSATPTATATPSATPTPQPPVAEFVGNPTSDYAPLSVAFTDWSTNTPTSWLWDFGDGSSITSQNPTHVYNNPGTYTVTLTSTNAAGSDSETKTNYITVNAHNPPPVADFIGNPTSGDVPLTVYFTNNSTGFNINSWSWDFGDGSPVSTDANPSHEYTTAGTYTVKLTVSNDGGSNTKTISNYINVLHNDPPVADFVMNPPSGNVPLTVWFTDASSGDNIYSWSWNFGNSQTSNQVNPIITYNTAGTFVVTLTVTNDAGSSTKQKTIVVSNNDLPQASFNGSPTSANIPMTVSFKDTSSGANINAWQWNFGDGSSNDTIKNPSHVYKNPGVYSVTLTVWNDAGSSTDREKNYITAISPDPTVPPMLAGILANVLKTISIEASADPTVWTQPAGTAIGLTTVNGTTATSINNSIYGLRAYGGTKMNEGITQAIIEFNSANYQHGNRRYIVLLSDGYSQSPEDDIAAAQEAANQNITIYTIGIGMPDKATLENIAEITGGHYTKVSSLTELVNAFSAIANNMTDIAGYNISMCTYTNYSNITYNLAPDTEYVNGSTIVTMPGGQKVNVEPVIYRDDPNKIYRLTWPNIGNLSYNQNMTINYQLKVLTAGNITPITNDSFVGFWTKDGNFTQSSFSGPTLYVNGTSNNTPTLAPPDLTVTIDTPAENATVTSQRLLISWNTIYTGSDTYNQMIKCNDVPLLPLPPNGYTSGMTQPWQYTWDISSMPSGRYTINVYAYDSYCNSTSSVNITIDHSSGKIRLE